jgi:cytochrome P450
LTPSRSTTTRSDNGAGVETVARLLSWAAVTLARNPEQRERLVRDPSLMPNAVEELLRYEAPSPVNGRWVTQPVEFHGVTIPAESKILLLNGSANRDRREYKDPDRFDVTRSMTRHISFGYGTHLCLGAVLARLEGRIALEATVARFPRWEIDEKELVMVRTSTVRGFSSVPFHLG